MKFLKAVFIVSMLLPCFIVDAGNYDSNILSNDALLTGGAQTALSDDGGALWYNPAGLGPMNRKQISLSGNAFMLRVRNNPGFLTTVLGDEVKESGSSSYDFFSIPSSFVTALSLNPVFTLAAGVFVPYVDEYGYSINEQGESGGITYSSSMEIKDKINSLYYGFGGGWQVIPSLGLGFNIFGFYATESFSFGTTGFFTDDPQTQESIYFNYTKISREQTVHGLTGSLGLKWEFYPKWLMGIRISSPVIAVDIKTEYGNTVSAGIKGFEEQGDTYFFEEKGSKDDNGVIIIPMNFSFGLAYRSEKVSVSAEMQFHAPLENKEHSIKNKYVINARAGAKFAVTEKLWLGGGFFTDLSKNWKSDKEYASMDYFGVTLGGSYRSSYSLKDNEKKDAIVFGTTVGIRYAFGIGKFYSIKFEPLADDAAKMIQTGLNDADFHELSLHIGTELLFW